MRANENFRFSIGASWRSLVIVFVVVLGFGLTKSVFGNRPGPSLLDFGFRETSELALAPLIAAFWISARVPMNVLEIRVVEWLFRKADQRHGH